jgi:hypothetical protein
MDGEPEHVESTAEQQAAFSFVAARSFEDARPLKMTRAIRGAVSLMRPVVQGLA